MGAVNEALHLSTAQTNVVCRENEQNRILDFCKKCFKKEKAGSLYRFNPERIGGDSKNEVQVHSGFLSAYDSVRIRLITLIKQATGHRGDSVESLPKWHVYVTGHSLGGALATLLALELSSSQLAQSGAISVTMYNFGSPRVGNRRFAEIYNQKVKDSWRLVNLRDIIPTVPRLMGYCHVAQPVYLTAGAGNQTDEMENLDVLEIGYEAGIIGEATPDVIVNEFVNEEVNGLEEWSLRRILKLLCFHM